MRKNLLLSVSMILMLMIYSSLGSIQAQVQTFTTQIAASADDVEEIASGHYMVASSDIEFDKDLDEGSNNQQWAGLRFIAVTIPKGATITEAKIQFTSKSAPYDPPTECKMYFKIEDADNSAAFPPDEHPAPGLREVRGRVIVKDSVLWNVPQWITADEADVDELSPDLKKLVQAVVNRAGWASGNAIAFVLSGKGTGYRNTRSWDADPLKSAKLTVKYTATVGIPEISVSAIKMYPNPVTDQLTVQGLDNVKNLVIMDITGKTRQKINVTGNDATVNMSDLPKGMYLLKTGTQTLKFIKK